MGTTVTAIEGTDLEVFCVARPYSDVIQVTINCHHIADAASVAAFGCWARARMNGISLPVPETSGEEEGASRPLSSITFDTETLLGAGNVVGSESAELLARVLCERVAAKVKGSVPEVLLSLSLPTDVRTLDMNLLRQIATVATETLIGKRS